jgi:hypothetical protein
MLVGNVGGTFQENLTAALDISIVAVILTFTAERVWVVRPEKRIQNKIFPQIRKQSF